MSYKRAKLMPVQIFAIALAAMLASGAGAYLAVRATNQPIDAKPAVHLIQLRAKLAEAEKLAGVDVDSLVKLMQTHVPRPVSTLNAGSDTTMALELVTARENLAAAHQELANLRERLSKGFITERFVTVTDVKRAYALIEPKLMMSVDSLTNGAVIVTVANRRQLAHIGQRIDIKLDDCSCFLTLVETSYKEAKFVFGCERIGAPPEGQPEAEASVGDVAPTNAPDAEASAVEARAIEVSRR